MPITVTSQVSVRNRFGQFARLCEEAGEDSVDKVLATGEKIARAAAPSETGELKGGIQSVKLTRVTGAVRSTADHTMPQEDGAVPHDIPRSFGRPPPWGFGAAWDRPGAWHPGNRAQPFLAPALAWMRANLMRIAHGEYPG